MGATKNTPISLLIAVLLLTGCGNGIGPGAEFFSSVNPTNLITNGEIHSGFIVGTGVTVFGLGSVQVRIGSGNWETATGTSNFKLRLPIAQDGAFWALGTTKTIMIRLLDGNGATVLEKTYTPTRGINRDFNGDGFADLALSGPWSVSPQVFIFYGSSNGFSSTPDVTLSYPGADASSQFGMTSESAGDVNGDGYADLVVGAPTSDVSGTNNGRVYVYHGSATGIAAAPTLTIAYPGASGSNSYFGETIASGDTNGDGYDDIIANAWGEDIGGSSRGAVFVYHGSAAGLGAAPDVTINNPDLGNFDLFSRGIGLAGDVNGDTYSDLVVGSHGDDDDGNGNGRAFVFLGSAAGLSTTPDHTYGYPGATAASASMGRTVNGLGDINGDGYADIGIAAAGSDEGGSARGAIYVRFGSASGPSATPDITYVGSVDSDRISGITGLGDLNGDGFADFGYRSARGVHLYYGAANFSAANAEVFIAHPTSASGSNFGSFSFGASFDGSGYGDVVITASLDDTAGTDRGAAYVYYGSETGISSSPSLSIFGTEDSARFGENKR